MDWSGDYEALFQELRYRHPLFDLDPRAKEAQDYVASIYESLPVYCKGSECPIASRCPISHRLDIIGNRCLLEIREITYRLARYLQDIGLDNITYTDIQIAAHLTRIDVLIWRIEQLLAVQGMTLEEVTVSGNRSVVRQVSNPLLNELRSLLREQRALMDELMTSRRSRLERAEREGKMEKDFVRMLQQMAKRSANVLVSEESDAPALPPVNQSGNHSEEGGSS